MISICPIGNATGLERNTARARALGASMVVRGATELSEISDNVYECTLCGACTNNCMTGWDPKVFIQELKTEIVLNGVAPQYILDLVNKYQQSGNVFGLNKCECLAELEAVKSDVMFLAGHTAIFKATESVKEAIKVLDKAGVKVALDKNQDSGASLWLLTGKTAETLSAAKELANTMNKYKTVIVYDPVDLSLISHEFKEWGIEINAEVIGYNQFLLDLIEKGALKVKKSDKEYSLQDNYAYARELDDRTKSTSFFSSDDTYSEDEMKSIIKYAESKGLDVIPALETLGHLEKFLAYPQLAHLGEKDYLTIGRGFDSKPTCGCLNHPDFYSFVDTYITEVSELFNSKYIHIGLDETFDFTACKKCQELIKQGVEPKIMFLNHILHVYELCKSLGKRIMMWDDYFEYFDVVEELPRDIIMCNWNYMYVSSQPLGHWTNRVSKDWFSYYDKLGFEYLFCTNVHRASSTYTTDSFYDYGMRYKPLGALMTAWERSCSFYHGAYPCIYYYGKLISGEISKEQKAQAFKEILGGDEELANMFAHMNLAGAGGIGDITKKCENGHAIKVMYRDSLAFILPKLRERIELLKDIEAKEIATDMYNFTLEQYLQLIIQDCACDYFEGRDRKVILSKISYVKECYEEIQEFSETMWQKYRNGIKSDETICSLTRRFKDAFALLDDIYAKVEKDEEFGILHVDLMLPDAYGTPACKIEIEYESGVKEVVHKGQLKPSTVAFDFGGCFGYRFAIRKEKISKLIFTAYGEGATYPLNFRYQIDNNVYVAGSVLKVCGHVVNEQNVLTNDSRFAEMGYDDGVAHARDISLAKELHAIEVEFKEL